MYFFEKRKIAQVIEDQRDEEDIEYDKDFYEVEVSEDVETENQ